MLITTATRQGTSGPNADAAAVFRASDGTVAAALIDGIGHTPTTAAGVRHLAWSMARLAARHGGRSALVTAGAMVADPGIEEDEEPDGPAVVAVVHPDGRTVVHWLGDVRGYAWDGSTLTQITTDHTMGECLRTNARRALPEYRAHDNWVLLTISRALPTTVFEVALDNPEIVLLTSDGIHDALSADTLEVLVRKYAHDPHALADALVTTPAADTNGYRDDATGIVIARTSP